MRYIVLAFLIFLVFGCGGSVDSAQPSPPVETPPAVNCWLDPDRSCHCQVDESKWNATTLQFVGAWCAFLEQND